MEILNTILNILLFFVSLGVLVTIHELGHFISAKAFNVYVQEFALGFGPKIFSRTGKGKETKFSLRMIPLGGYCAMVGETEGVEVDPSIPKERYLTSKKKWQQGIIFGSGIALNFLLAIILFLVANLAFPQRQLFYYSTQDNTKMILPLVVNDDSPFKSQGIKTYDGITSKIILHNNNEFFILDEKSPATTKDGIEATYAVALDFSQYDSKLDDLSPILLFYGLRDDETINFGDVRTIEQLKTFTITLTFATGKENFDMKQPFVLQDDALVVKELPPTVIDNTTNKKLGLACYIHSYYLGVDGISKSFKDFGEGFTLIGRTIVGLFIGQGWDTVGGPIAIFNTTSSVLSDMGFGYYLWLWGLISVNLGLFNLMPFPGLDGWSILVTIIEGISRKKIPAKIKNAVQTVGMVLLFTLMIFVVIKDIFIS
ncbi:MAG: RIP metalloprotease RseP [Erysipelotrichaceae bacterium]|jgi:regulator of sigma E protease|nr:RIP metalloprotease RseP [Erysipelotrichaceae bacterium]